MQGMQSNIAWSMGKGRRNSLTNREGKKIPGPGNYKQGNMETVKQANPKWSIKGKGSGQRYTTDAPGPGQYSDGFKKHHGPTYSMGGKLSKSFYVDKSALPGPGQYKQDTSLGKKGGYIGGRPQDKRKNNVPGPGQYSMRSTFSNKGAGFGSGKRSSPMLRSVQMPGPGQYAPQSDFGRRTHGAGFGTGKRSGLQGNNKMPGPGQYAVNDALFRDQKAASLKGRPQTTKVDNRPGPGHYASKSVHTSPAYSMGVKTKLKQLAGKDVPDPTSYNPDYTKVKYATPGVNFGSPSKNKPMGDSSMPGPGQYDAATTVGTEGPGYTIKGRYNDPRGDQKPGPGNYNPKDEYVRHGTPGTVMGSGQRSKFGAKGDGPGPGNYDTSGGQHGPLFSFGSGMKGDNSLERRSKQLPGPGQYPAHTFMGKDSQGKSILGKPKDKRPDELPGPGQYQAHHKRNGPSYSISGHRTEDPVMKEKAKMPPPGTYDGDDTAVRHKSPGVSFGGKPKVQMLRGDGMPGPGQYQLASTLDKKGVHIAGKTPEVIKERAPGPGQYELKGDPKHKNAPSFSIGGVKGDGKIPGKDMPGPGQYYSPERPQTGGFHFGSEQRKGLANKNDMPAPGQYTIPTRMGTEGKSIVIAGRYEDKKDTNQVGPGQYTIPSTNTGPKFSMGAGEKGFKVSKDASLGPSPGSYDVSGKHHPGGVVFGTDKRDHSRKDDMPGPGNYAIPSTITQKGISIQGRHDIKEKEKAPGPGAYENPNDPSKTHGGKVSFGTGAKSSVLKDSGAPGPGQYLIKMPYDKGPKIGQDLRDKPQKSDMPGPGQYNTRREEGLTYY